MITPASLVSPVVALIGYVLTALGLYTIAKRRRIKHPWLAWIPVADMWLLGCISDQFRYVAKGQVCNKRKSMLTLSIVWILLLVWCLGILLLMFTQILPYLPEELRTWDGMADLATMDEMEQTEYFESLAGQMGMMSPQMSRTIAWEALIMAVPLLVAVGCMVAHTILMFMAYYDLFFSAEPASAGLRLVLSIVLPAIQFGSLLRPIFVFTCRNKDGGMPPRGGADSRMNARPEFEPYEQ